MHISAFKNDLTQFCLIDWFPHYMHSIGSLVGGNIAEEIIPVSIADFFVTDKRSWLKFQNDQASSTAGSSNSALFKESRSALTLGEYTRSANAAWKIKHSPEGGFEYTADLAFSFSTNLGIIKKISSIGQSLSEELPTGRRGREEVRGLRTDIASDERYSIFDNGNKNNSEHVDKGRRKLFGRATTHERESLISDLKGLLKAKSPSEPTLRPYSLSEAMVIHEVSFLDTIKGIATSQHIVQTQKVVTKDKVV